MVSRVVEVDEEGALLLPSDVIDHSPPRTRYVVTVRGDVIVLEPVHTHAPLWATASPQERADDLVRWAENHAGGPGLPDEALRRERLYD